ncbi:hypothetical protein Tco_1008292 [Tanacetum coccineum]
MLQVGYEDKWFMNLYTEHHDYDVLEFLTIEGNVNDTLFESSDEYESSDEVEEIDYVDFHTEEPIDDPDAASIDPLFKVKKGVSYPKHNPTIPWNEMNVEAGRCVGMYSNLNNVAKRKLFADDSSRSEKKSNTPKKSQTGKKAKPKKKQGTPFKKGRPIKKLPKWTKSKIISDKKQGHVCGFRLWQSWMTTEQSFHIKSLHPEHKCSRNYKLGSLVTYKWIAHQFAKEIINDPFMPYIKLKDAIRQKFLIDVSIGQCKRAKQRTLYDHEGGLIEHYGRLWERQALLESNPGSTCRLDMEEISCGKSYFKIFYICIKGMKDGWLEGCRRVIGLDGCFLNYTSRGELLTPIGRDANNQMYPISWAVVRVENSEN